LSTLEQETDQVTHRDREGNQITLGEWARLWEDSEYRKVARTEHLDAVVQTQWEGIDDGVQVATMYHTGIRWAGEWTTVWEGFHPCTEDDAKRMHREITCLLREMCPEPSDKWDRAEFRRRLKAAASPQGI
jgi:hypothetical protein